ncbi:MAG: RHS repeat-associated core domain-containing protein [Planctomycetota bacterium]
MAAVVALALGASVYAQSVPVANDDNVTICVDQSTVLDVLDNDEDADLDPLYIVPKIQPQFGTVTVSIDGTTITYNPNLFFIGVDSFTYCADDQVDGLSAEATVMIDVTGGQICDIDGTPGDDTILDDPMRPDTICGNDGDDIIWVRGTGGAMPDKVSGGPGYDTLIIDGYGPNDDVELAPPCDTDLPDLYPELIVIPEGEFEDNEPDYQVMAGAGAIVITADASNPMQAKGPKPSNGLPKDTDTFKEEDDDEYTDSGRDYDGVACVYAYDDCGVAIPNPNPDCPRYRDEQLSDPIDLSTGNFRLAQTDLMIPGIGQDFQFVRTYRSRMGIWSRYFRRSVAGDQPIDVMTQPLGMNWDHNWNMRVFKPVDPTASQVSGFSYIKLFAGNGRGDNFVKHPTEGYYTSPEYHAIIDYDAATGVAKYITAEYTEYEFHSTTGAINPGMLKSVTDRNGNTMVVNYVSPSDDRISTIETTRHVDLDDDGVEDPGDFFREITFTYHDDAASPLSAGGTDTTNAHLLWKISDWAGREVEYRYEVNIAPSGTSGEEFWEGVSYVKDRLTEVRLPEIESSASFPLDTVHERFNTTAASRRTWTFGYEADESATALEDGVSKEYWAWWSGQLTSVTDPNGDVVTQNFYSAPSWEFSHNDYRVEKQVHGTVGTTDTAYHYQVTRPDGTTLVGTASDVASIYDGDYIVWVNDRRGYVVKMAYAGWGSAADPRRLLSRTDYDVNVDPDVTALWWQLTGTPQEYVTAVQYNDDWHVTELDEPGNETVSVEYYRDSVPGATDPRQFGNITKVTRENENDALDTIETTYEYDFAFGSGGCCGSNYFTAAVDDRGSRTEYVYDDGTYGSAGDDGLGSAVPGVATGDLLRIKRDKPSGGSDFLSIETFEYNARGLRTKHTHPEHATTDSTTHSRVDEFTWDLTAGDNSYGFMTRRTIDTSIGGANLHTDYEYDVVGNVTKITEPDGQYTTRAYNQANQVVIERAFNASDHKLAETQFFYDANGNMVRMDVWDVVVDEGTGNASDADGNTWITTLYQYDELDYRIRSAREIGGVLSVVGAGVPELSGTGGRGFDLSTLDDDKYDADGDAANGNEAFSWAVTEYVYDANKNRTVVRHPEAVNGVQANNVDITIYDERNLIVRRFAGLFDGFVNLGDGSLTAAPATVRLWNAGPWIETSYTRDAKGRVSSTSAVDAVDSLTRDSTVVYDAFDRVVKATDPMGNETFYQYDGNHNVERVARCGAVDADDAGSGSDTVRVLSYIKVAYDARDREISRSVAIFDSGSSAPACSFAGDGTIADITPTSWQVTATAYNDDDSVRFVAVPSGASPGMPNPAVSAASQPSGVSATSYFYDTAARIKEIADELENRVEYYYNTGSNVGLIIRTDDGDLNPSDGDEEIFATGYLYDGLDRRIEVVDGVYDALATYAIGTPTLSGADALEEPSNSTVHTYDSRSNRIGTTDPRGSVTNFAYDGLGRLVETEVVGSLSDSGSLGGTNLVTQVVYDTSSRVTRRIDDSDNATRYFYDSLGRETAMVMADSSSHTTRYDLFGDPVELTDARGLKQDLTFDDNGRLTRREITFPTSQEDLAFIDQTGPRLEVFTYDGAGRVLSANNYTDLAATSPIVEITRAYESRSLMTTETFTVLGATSESRTVTHTYNDAGVDASCTYPSTRVLDTAHDELNRLSEIKDGGPTGDSIVAYTYIGPGRATTRTVNGGSNELATTYQYSGYLGYNAVGNDNYGVGMVRAITHTGAAAFEVRWDEAGNKVAHNQLNEGAVRHKSRRDRTFDYDTADRLIESVYSYPDTLASDVVGSVFIDGGSMVYALDGVHNRSTVTAQDPDGAGGLGSAPPAVGFRALSDSNGQQYGDDFDGSYTLNKTTEPAYDGTSVNQYAESPRHGQLRYDANGNLVIRGDAPSPADLDGDGDSDADDFIDMLVAFGRSCSSVHSPPPAEPDGQCECVAGDTGSFVRPVPSGDTNSNGKPDYGCLGIDDPATVDTLLDRTTDLDGDGSPDLYCAIKGDVDGDCDADADDFIAVLVGFGTLIDRTTMRYDWRNQLSTVTGESPDGVEHEAVYVYDAFNRRIRSDETVYDTSVSPSTSTRTITEFVYGGQANWQLIAEYDVDVSTDAATLSAEYVYGNYIDEVVEMKRHLDATTKAALPSPEHYYYAQDDLFSVYAIVDDLGDVVERYEYGDYGSLIVLNAEGYDIRDVDTTDMSGTVTITGTPDGMLSDAEAAEPIVSTIGNRHAFTGRVYDAVTGLMQYRNRYMLPSLGRFVQRDQLGTWYDTGSRGNAIQYAHVSPLLGVDPYGLETTTITTTDFHLWDHLMMPRGYKRAQTRDEALEALDSCECDCYTKITIDAHSQCGEVILPGGYGVNQRSFDNELKNGQDASLDYLDEIVDKLCEGGEIEFVQCDSFGGTEGEKLISDIYDRYEGQVTISGWKGSVKWSYGSPVPAGDDKKCPNRSRPARMPAIPKGPVDPEDRRVPGTDDYVA